MEQQKYEAKSRKGDDVANVRVIVQQNQKRLTDSAAEWTRDRNPAETLDQLAVGVRKVQGVNKQENRHLAVTSTNESAPSKPPSRRSNRHRILAPHDFLVLLDGIQSCLPSSG
jgi:hypothetical protein